MGSMIVPVRFGKKAAGTSTKTRSRMVAPRRRDDEQIKDGPWQARRELRDIAHQKPVAGSFPPDPAGAERANRAPKDVDRERDIV